MKSTNNLTKNNTRIIRLAEMVGAANLLDRYPDTLSGGESQRVALARTLAINPKCLLLDEPLSSLDVGSRAEMRSLLRKINTQGQTIIHVTHDYEEAISLATNIAIMEAGEIIQTGKPTDVFQHPKSEFVARFIGIKNIFRGNLQHIDVNKKELAEFISDGLIFHLLTDADNGDGYLLVRSEDITVSLTSSTTSARNTFRGKILDIIPAKLGVELIVDIGVEIYVLVTLESIKTLDLHQGKDVWLTFKATAIKFIAK